MIDIGDVDLAMEGALNGALALMAFTEGVNDPVEQGLVGVVAGINAARTMIREIAVDGEETPGVCPHPEDKVVTRRAGKTTIRICELCNEIIE